MKMTIPVKLKTTSAHVSRLLATMDTFNEICNGLSDVCFHEGIFNKFAIQKLLYHPIRSCYDIPAQLVVRAISKVSNSYKKNNKTLCWFKPRGAITYDTRVLRWKENEVSIATITGRITIPFVCSEKQKESLRFQEGETDLIYRNGTFFLHTTCEIKETLPIEAKSYLGVDMGITNIAYDSKGNQYSGEHVTVLRKRHVRLRKKLQSKGTKSAKRLLKKRNKKEQRFAKDINHQISKKIIETAKRHSIGISLEDLKGICQRVTVRKKQRYSLHSWSFYDLKQKILYKARLVGVPVILVDPKYTSQECSKCGYIKKSNRKSQSKFSCSSCGHAAHADYNAACVISSRAAVNRPYISGPQQAAKE